MEGLPASKRKMKVKNLRLLTDSNSNAKLQRYKVLKDKFAREYIKEQNKQKQTAHKYGRTLVVKPSSRAANIEDSPSNNRH